MDTADTVAIFSYREELDARIVIRMGQLLAQLLAFAAHDGRVRPSSIA